MTGARATRTVREMSPHSLVAALSLVTALLLAGCGSTKPSGQAAEDPSPRSTASASADPGRGSEGADPTSSPQPSATVEAAYLVRADTAKINRVARVAQDAGQRAGTERVTARCNRFDAYPAWRACWHDVLDPYRTSLAALGTTMTAFEDRGFPEDCVTELRRAGATYAGLSGQVGGLLRGIDSPSRAAQTKAIRGYWRTLGRVGRRFSAPFRPVTQVCYSPRDLASINASPTPSASASATP